MDKKITLYYSDNDPAIPGCWCYQIGDPQDLGDGGIIGTGELNDPDDNTEAVRWALDTYPDHEIEVSA
jgi:hypothetical protein